MLVGSYPAVSPLPACSRTPAVCFLWHCPAGHPGLPLATTLPCGARTFLGGGQTHRRGRPVDSSVARPMLRRSRDAGSPAMTPVAPTPGATRAASTA